MKPRLPFLFRFSKSRAMDMLEKDDADHITAMNAMKEKNAES